MNNEVIQVGVRLVKERTLMSDVRISSPSDAVKLLVDTFGDMDREVFGIMNFQTDLRPINLNVVSVGTIDQSIVHPREILKSAILSNAAAVLLFHTHPSGNLTPSKEDISSTDRLLKAFNLMGINVLDHIIISDDTQYYSFKEKEVLQVLVLNYSTSLNDIDFSNQKVAEIDWDYS